MNTSHAISRLNFALFSIAAFAFGLALPVSAQQDGEAKSSTPLPAQKTEVSSEPPNLDRRGSKAHDVIPEINISAGQDLAGIAEILSKASGVNFVVDESLKQMKIPPLKLRNVTVSSVLDAIRLTAKQRIMISYSEDRGPAALVVTIVPNGRAFQDSKPIKICRIFRLADPVSNALIGGDRFIRNTLKQIPEGKTQEEREAIVKENRKTALTELVEQISEATQQACSALTLANGQRREKAEDYPQIEVNVATQLLIVTGDEADVDIVGQIMSGMGGVPMSNVAPVLPKRDQEQRSSVIRR